MGKQGWGKPEYGLVKFNIANIRVIWNFLELLSILEIGDKMTDNLTFSSKTYKPIR